MASRGLSERALLRLSAPKLLLVRVELDPALPFRAMRSAFSISESRRQRSSVTLAGGRRSKVGLRVGVGLAGG